MSRSSSNGHAKSTGPLVVVGDALLDVDVVGSADRLCPDAPVPVVDSHERRYRAGGAGLAALLAAAKGHDVVFVSAVGGDPIGERLRGLLRDRVDLLLTPMSGTTQTKMRVWANGQVLLRLDEGDGRAAGGDLDSRVSAVIRSARAILVSDYGRGMAAHPGIRELLAARAPGTPLVWDPHPRGTAPVAGADVVTPNEAEAAALVPAPPHGAYGEPGHGPVGDHDDPAAPGPEPAAGTSLDEIGRRAAHLREYWQSASVAVTAASRGVVLADGAADPRHLPPPHVLANGDACGAGDDFAATVTAALGDGMARTDAVRAAVNAASHFVTGSGAAGMAAARSIRRRATPRPSRATTTRSGWWRPSAPVEAASWRPEDASTCCTPGTRACSGAPAPSATRSWCASTTTPRCGA
ncbi:bifunctional heptose 7-phosphate kinase/heptose 1-phosphate adenyltransferase [Allosalinactinospora lopnorensis]|uniref:bifunctional heptose 7-phosphate kinase/heptose 1-phosphate adenyltransferase n=1 Tax=Allosalinactinospora lopnorensis TaxID=1352348 RepID=UPI0009E3F967|nr:PfkB family carbohydrate kinase [Allosalinactinospora lopnorensis]